MKIRTLPTVAIALLLALTSPLVAQEVVTLPAAETTVDPVATDLWSVGGFEAVGWDAFGEVSQVAFDGEGNLYVFDRQSSRISVVGPDGELIRQFGEAGEGPGEMRSPGTMAVTRDGRVFVQDGGHRAYLEYDAEREFVRSVPIRVEGGLLKLSGIVADPTGARLFTAPGAGGFTLMTRDGPGIRPGVNTAPTRPVERIILGDSARTSDFYSAWAPPPAEVASEERRGPGGMVMRMGRQRIWVPQLRFDVLPDGGLAVVDSSAYEVRIVDAQGRHVRTLVRPSVEPTRVTDRVRAREIDRRLDEIQVGDTGMRMMINDGSGARPVPQDQLREMQRGRLEEAEFWPEIPVVAALSVGWDGLIWLERAQTDPTEEGPIDLFRTNGTWAGTIPAEADFEIPRAFGPNGLAAWIDRDEFDVATVTVRRLGAGLR